MNSLKKSLFAAWAFVVSCVALGNVHAANLATNIARCTTNSGSIAVSYNECVGLAWLYHETNGDSWWENTNWFSSTDLGLWAGAAGNSDLFRDAFQNPFASGGGHITELYLYNNNLSGAINTGFLMLPYLTVISLGGNSVSSVNLSNNTALEVLSMNDNRLTSIDLSSNTGLSSIHLSNNFLTTGINILDQRALTFLELSNNGITWSLSFTGQGTGLIQLYLEGNFLTGLTLTTNTRLQQLHISGNNLTSLDLSSHTWLTELYAQNNLFTSLSFYDYTAYPGGLVARFDSMARTPSDNNTLRFLHTYDPNRGRRGFGGGKPIVLKKDDCPNGDTSRTQYDGMCENKPAGGSANVAASGNVTHSDENTGAATTATGTIQPTEDENAPVVEEPCSDAETQKAYTYAYDNSMTTMPTCQKARTDDSMTRAEAAKIMSNYAINVLGHSPNTDNECSFADMSSQDAEMQSYAIAACQLGIMGLQGDGSVALTFSPEGLVDKAQLATMISRLLYGSENNSTTCWYCNHVAALKTANIITIDTDLFNPLHRGWAMLMLMRAQSN